MEDTSEEWQWLNGLLGALGLEGCVEKHEGIHLVISPTFMTPLAVQLVGHATNGWRTSFARQPMRFEDAMALPVEPWVPAGLPPNDHGSWRASMSVSGSQSLHPDQAEELFDMLQEAGFWSLPSRDGADGLHGETWMLGVVRGGDAHILQRWSPEGFEEYDLLTEACRLLIWRSGACRLAGKALCCHLP